MRFQVWDLDVWGNETDGFAINNRSRREVIEAECVESRSQPRVLAACIEAGLFQSNVTVQDLDVDDPTGEGSLWIENAKTGEPLYELEPLDDDDDT